MWEIPVIVDVIHVWKVIILLTLVIYSSSRLFFDYKEERVSWFFHTLLVWGLTLSLIAYFAGWKIVIERPG